MSTSTATPSVNPTIQSITNLTLNYTPATIAGVLAAEQSNAAGATKLQSVVNGVLATTGSLETNTNPNVAAISALANLFVSIFNDTGLFSSKTKTASTAVVPASVV